MNSPGALQENLFQHIKAKLPPHLSFVHEISELLGISYDSAYRRIRGEKKLTLEELNNLCRHFQISLDTLFSVDNQNIVFTSLAIGEKGYTLDQWLQEILRQVKEIHGCKQKEFFYSAKDIPVFHFFEFPELFAFKIFFWNKVLFTAPGFENALYRFDLADRFLQTGREILAIYNKIPTVEIWNEETFSSLIRQVEYCYICGYFGEKEEILKVLEILKTMLMHLQQQAESGFRYMFGTLPEGVDGNYRFYCNEVLLGDNTIFISADGHLKTCLTYNVINLLITENPTLCRQIEVSLRNLTKKSTLISSTSEKERRQFFSSICRKIKTLEDSVNS
ncbi:MAG: helix-turn-helix domain-containing protein [Bacteroidetes bacterium]|nr:helix-turn-helix domain-containing protein [Bacteroidota bacterium]